MQVRRIGAGIAIAAVAVFGVAACGEESKDGAASSSASASTSAGHGEHAGAELTKEAAQDVLRKAVDPATPADQVAGLVAGPPEVATALVGWAKGASRGGYTPDVFTVTEVTPTGDGKAKATVSIKSPHTPAPITLPLDYEHADGVWKLTSAAATSLAAQGRR